MSATSRSSTATRHSATLCASNQEPERDVTGCYMHADAVPRRPSMLLARELMDDMWITSAV